MVNDVDWKRYSLEAVNDLLREDNTRLKYRLWRLERFVEEIRLQAPQIAGALDRILISEPCKLDDQCHTSKPTT